MEEELIEKRSKKSTRKRWWLLLIILFISLLILNKLLISGTHYLSFIMEIDSLNRMVLKTSCLFTSLKNENSEIFTTQTFGEDKKIEIKGVSIPLNICEACEVVKQTHEYVMNTKCNCSDLVKKDSDYWNLQCGIATGPMSAPYFWYIDESERTIYFGAL